MESPQIQKRKKQFSGVRIRHWLRVHKEKTPFGHQVGKMIRSTKLYIEDSKGIWVNLASEKDGPKSKVKKLEEKVEELFNQVKVLQVKVKKKSEEVVRKLCSKTMETLAQIQNLLSTRMTL